MCGRFTLKTKPEALVAHFGTEGWPEEGSYNIPPTRVIPTIRVPGDGRRRLVMVRWGLVPSWAKEMSNSAPQINARLETVDEKPMFRQSFQQRRCLIPADGFYEWRRNEPTKRAYAFQLPDGEPFAFAGIWDRWSRPDGQVVESCAMLTMAANAVMAPIHHRAPVILAPDTYDDWLDPALQDVPTLRGLLTTTMTDRLVATRISNRVNQVSNDDPDLLTPVPDEVEAPRELTLFDLN